MARAVTVLLAACAAVASAVGNGIHKSGIYEIEPRRGSAQVRPAAPREHDAGGVSAGQGARHGTLTHALSP